MPSTARALAVLTAAAALGLGACDGGSDDAKRISVALDFTPNAVHAPLYATAADDSDRVDLRIRPPGAGGPDSLKLLGSGRVDLAVLDIHDLALARERGVDVVGVAALVQRPLGALIAQAGIDRPRDLENKTVGVSGLPSDPAFVKAIVEHDGGDFDRVRQVTIGFNAVGSLVAKKIDAVPAFWNAEGVTLRQRGVKTREFRVESFGAPVYPEVVLVTTRETLNRKRGDIEKALEAIHRGSEKAGKDRDATAGRIATAARTKDVALVRAQLDAVAPATTPPLRLDREALERWADFDARVGLVKRRPDVSRAFDFGLAD